MNFSLFKGGRVLIITILALVFFISCSDDDDGPMNNPMPEEEMCEDVTATFAGVVQPIINAACAISGCHVGGGSGNGNFETYAGVKAKADNGSLLNRAVIQGNMPPSNTNGPMSLTDDQKLAIECWIDDGAQDN